MLNPIKAAMTAGSKMIRPAVTFARGMKAKKPEIFVFAGVTLILTSFGLVIYETMKLGDTMTAGKEKLDAARQRKADLESGEGTKVPVSVKDENGNEIFTDQFRVMSDEEVSTALKQASKDIQAARMDAMWQVGKLYALPLVFLLIGLGFDLHGVRILRKENVALAATVGGLEKFISFYRGNVVREQGKEADLRYARGIVGEREVSEIVKDADGNEKIAKKKLPVISHADGNPWRFEYSPTFFRSATGDPDRDISHIKNVQDYWNHKYGGQKKHGKISYYEVLEYLDPIWEAIDADGTVETFCREYGWGHSATGDDYIDLGVYRAINDNAIKGIGDCVWIEGNCDGRLADIKNQYKEKYLP